MKTANTAERRSSGNDPLLGIILVVFSILLILAVHETVVIGSSTTRTVDIAVIGAVIIVIGACFATRNVKVKRTVLFAFYLLAVLEIIFQALALGGILPRLNTYSDVPYGRVYWTVEGHANATMNRYGWYYPPFRLERGSRRIVLIGDSMVQGLQVKRRENVGVVLENLLHHGAGPRTEVLSCGLSGTDPAHYLELCRYAAERFHPDEIILCVFIGNDFAHVHRGADERVNLHDRQIYYFIDGEGTLTLHPGSEHARRALRRMLAYNHRGLHTNVYRIARSHYLTREVLLQAAGAALRRGKRPPAPKGNRIAAGLGAIGLDDFIFKKELGAEGDASIDVVTGLLERANRLAASYGITLRIVTIPVFPSFFFERYRGPNWSLETEEYDFLRPEAILTEFADRHGIPVLALGHYMRETGLRADRIEKLFFNGGSGHFTPAGHRYTAEAIYAAFYGRDTGYAAVQ